MPSQAIKKINPYFIPKDKRAMSMLSMYLAPKNTEKHIAVSVNAANPAQIGSSINEFDRCPAATDPITANEHAIKDEFFALITLAAIITGITVNTTKIAKGISRSNCESVNFYLLVF